MPPAERHIVAASGGFTLLHRLVADGTLPTSYAIDDGVAVHYRGTEVADVVADRADAYGYHVERDASGAAVETRLPTRLLPGARDGGRP